MQDNYGYKEWVRSYARKNWYLIVILGVLAIVGVGLQLITPIPLQLLIDNVLSKEKMPQWLEAFDTNQFTLAILLVGVYFAINISQLLFNYFQGIIQVKFYQRIDKAAMLQTYDDAIRIPYNDPLREDPRNNLYAITGQSQEMSNYILSNSVTILQSSLALLGSIIILVTINFSVVGFILLAIPFLVISIRYFNKVIEMKASNTEESHGAIFSFISESLTKLRTIQAFAYGQKRRSKLKDLVDVRNKNAISQLKSTQLYDLSTQTIFTIVTAAALIIGSYSVLNNTMTLGMLVLVLYYMDLAFGQIAGLVETAGSMSSQRAALRQAYEPVDRAKTFSKEGTTDPIKGKIEFRNVTVAKGGLPVLTNINFVIPAGSMVGIIGPSGSGKTTFIDTILRFTLPQSGYVLIDDRNIKDFNLDHLRKNIALVEQEPDIFNDTLNENIALADPERNSDLIDVVAATEAADLTEFVQQRNAQNTTVIDNDSLSGGQKQRIAVARAFYKIAPILIMDEPTSALDRTAGQKVVNQVIKLAHNRTTLVVTHDMDLLKKIPYVLVVKDGSIRPVQEYGGLDAYFASTELLQ